MTKSLSSQNWLYRQKRDPFVKSAQKQGYRARSVFKLIELDERYQLLNQANCVIDLGSSPGAWSQYTAEKIPYSRKRKIIALDLLEMPSIGGVDFIQGDFSDNKILQKVKTMLNQPIDVVLSDLAPNSTGIRSVDNDRSMYLVECALDFALQHLKVNGHFVTKIFQGSGFEALINQSKKYFSKVITKKPTSSRKESREIYLVALNRLSDTHS